VLHLEVDDLTRAEVVALLAEHLADMRATSPAESVHALDVTALRHPRIEFWSAWSEGRLVGCGALKLGDGEVELKSMRTARAARGRGVGGTVLRHLLDRARVLGARRVLLETGSQEFFAPARRLYARHGFTVSGPFWEYVEDPSSVFMELSLTP
jgi:putative acetyltransferase